MCKLNFIEEPNNTAKLMKIERKNDKLEEKQTNHPKNPASYPCLK